MQARNLFCLLMLVFCSLLFSNAMAASVAFESVKKVAEEMDDASAQFLLGHMYATGQDTAKNVAVAIQWLEKAATKSHPDAPLRLGRLYLEISDHAKARAWFNNAASKGNAEAIYWLGHMAYHGLGEKINYPRALASFEKASALGNLNATTKLAYMHDTGSGLPQNAARAAELYTKAANGGIPEAQFRLALMYRDGRGVKANAKLAMSLLQASAAKGHAEAVQLIASGVAGSSAATRSLAQSNSIQHNQSAASESSSQLLLRANDGDAHAQYLLSIQLESGNVKLRDVSAAFAWVKKAAQKKHLKAQLRLAEMYSQGRGVKKNPKEAATWYKAAALQGNSDAAFYVANYYREGLGIKLDYQRALEWYTFAAQKGHTGAQIQLGTMYAN